MTVYVVCEGGEDKLGNFVRIHAVLLSEEEAKKLALMREAHVFTMVVGEIIPVNKA